MPTFAANMLNAASQQFCGNIIAMNASFNGNSIPTAVRSYIGSVGGGSVSTATVTTAMAAGNVAVITVSCNNFSGRTVNNVTDTAGNTWTAVANSLATNTNFSGTVMVQSFRSVIATGGSSVTITVTFSGNVAFPLVTGEEFTGIDTTTPVQTATNNTGNAVPSSGTITATGNVVLLSAFYMQTQNAPIAPPWVGIYGTIPGLLNQFFADFYQFVTPNSPNVLRKRKSLATVATGRQYAYYITLERLF